MTKNFTRTSCTSCFRVVQVRSENKFFLPKTGSQLVCVRRHCNAVIVFEDGGEGSAKGRGAKW